jgi:hypothetical protein
MKCLIKTVKLGPIQDFQVASQASAALVHQLVRQIGGRAQACGFPGG